MDNFKEIPHRNLPLRNGINLTNLFIQFFGRLFIIQLNPPMKLNNSASVVAELIRHHSIPVSKTSIQHELHKHPESRSFFGISDVFSHWKIPNQAYEVKLEALPKLPLPCLVLVYVKKGDFAVLHRIDETHVYLSNDYWRMHKMPLDEFKKLYSGKVLVVQPDGAAGEDQFKQKRREELVEEFRYPALAIGGVLAIAMGLWLHGAFLEAISVQSVLLALLKTAGLCSSVLLLMHSINPKSPVVQRFCGQEKADCESVLSSKAAKVSGFLSWAEIGSFYFFGSWLYLLFSRDRSSALSALLVLNALCLPYTVYSIYYQWRVAKTWCRLCLSVQIILWLEFFTFLPSYFTFRFPGIETVAGAALAFLLPVLTWGFLKPLFKETQKVLPLKDHLKTFKFNHKVFTELLNAQTATDLPDEADTLVFGDPDAKNMVTMVSNPFCRPCAETHAGLHRWLHERESFKLQVIFAVGKDTQDKKYRMATAFQLLYQSDKEVAEQALNDWYAGKYGTMENFFAAHPVTLPEEGLRELAAQAEWCAKNKIRSTPTLLINGRPIPFPWQYTDLKYFI